ncbi:thioredoxin domain-containing protein 2 [Talpa occidentalis]|uniref:thioredoxin domain-containing protein 2 n=1 Tax=Talpa occidentalis TaxID=50954 RepID=UPI0018906DEA|nr:thioredoxin domain-containing protein 2 [Talpa occidentalis]
MESDKVGGPGEQEMRPNKQEETNEERPALQVTSNHVTLLVLDPAHTQTSDAQPTPAEESEILQPGDTFQQQGRDILNSSGNPPKSSEEITLPKQGEPLQLSEETTKSMESDSLNLVEDSMDLLGVDMVKEILSKEDFETALKEAGERLVIVDFSATWCGPCKTIKPLYHSLSVKYEDVVFLEVDADECEELVKDRDIICIPTFQFYKKEEKVGEFCGALTEKLEEIIVELK